MPLVSVVLPVFHTEKYLPRTIASLLAQTLTDAEFIFVDDGSSDASREIITAAAEKDARIRLLCQMHEGAGGARNRGLSEAKGEAVLFLDSDDFFEPDMLEVAYRRLKEHDADICVFAAYEYDETTGEERPLDGSLRTERCPAERPFSPKRMPRYLFNSFRLEVWNKLFRRSFLTDNGIRYQSLPNTNDIAFTIEALATANRITTVDRPLIHYCVNRPGSLQNTRDKEPTAFCKAYAEARDRLEKRGVYEYYKRSFLYSFLVCNCEKYKALKTEKGRREQSEYVKQHAEPDFRILSHASCYYINPARLDEYAAILGIQNYRATVRHRLLYAVQIVPCKLRGLLYRLQGKR
ncbi:MAG: glycosyltransferase family 2 protein [Clostridia bacterium]|nr:glycosyltransferase family 2 protein [Clostridia bacterium]